MRTALSLIIGTGLLLAGYTGTAQQLRLGSTPYSTEKSAVLELQSDRQGLLLCRITDTALINTMSPPDGMLIYFTPTKRVLIRANGSWQTLAPSTSTIASLNGLTGNTQTFATGSAGTDFNISSAGTAHTFNIPDAGAAARGVITTGAQTIAGSKTFSSAPLFSSLTAGSVPFIGTGGLLSQNNTNLFWDATNNRLGIGTNTPSTALHLLASNGNLLYLQTLTGGGTGTANILFKTYTGAANPTAQIGVTDDGSYSSHITFSTKTPGGDANALAERVRITSSGNVGIGISTPAQKLDVRGAIVSSATTYPNYAYNSANRMAFGESNVPANETGSVVQYGSGSNTRNMIFAFTKTNVNTSFFGNDGTQMMLGSESTAPITFRTGLVYTSANIIASGSEAMRITSTGLVGIGTTTPSTALHVAGTNPLTLMGVQAGTSTSADSLLTITGGLVRKLPMSTFASAFTTGNLTESGSGILTITGGTNAVAGSGTTIQVKQASASQNGFLSSADWSAFNSKLSSVDTGSISNFYLKSRGLLSAGSGITYNTTTGVISSSISTGNFWTLGGNAVASAQNLGTTSNYYLPFITNNTERMRLSSTGNLGIGVTDPTNPLVVKDTMEIRRTGSMSQLLFSNTAGAGDFRIGGDGGDIFWQGGGGRSLQMGSYWGMILGGDRQSGTLPAFSNGSGNTGVLVQSQRDASIPLAIQANSATQSGNLTEWRSSTTVMDVVDKNGNLGIGTTAPSTKLHVTGTNPLTLTGVQTGTSTSADSLLTITSGLVRKLPVSTFSSASSLWAQGGNTVTTMKTLGTIDNYHLPFITNNTERMRISNTGNVGIGTSSFDGTNPEKLLIDAGTTTSYNLVEGHGKINSYLQLNIQNDSSGTASSSDIVASANNGTESANFVDLGINSSGYSATGVLGGANNGYLYSTGNDFVIGNATTGKSLLLFTGGTNASNEAMRIDNNGKVGIATTSPQAKLDVGGDFKLGSSGTVLTGMFKTSVSITDNSNNISYTQSLTKTVTVTGAAVNGSVIVTPRSALPNGVGIAWSRVSASGSVQINFINSGAGVSGNQLLGTITFDITIIQ